MSKQFFSAVIFALLCTGNISPESLNATRLQKFDMQTIASYQAMSQNAVANLQDNDDEEEETGQEETKT